MGACPACFTVMIDLNTWNAAELTAAINTPSMRYDGIWNIPENSHDVSDALWNQAYNTLGRYVRGNLVAEEYGVGNTVCNAVSAQAGFRVTGSFQYYETGFSCTPGNCPVISNSDVTKYASQCAAPVIALTRAYSNTYNGGGWANAVNSIIGNPNLQGIGWEFQPSLPFNDPVFENFANWINGVVSNGKKAYLLWGFYRPTGEAIERQVSYFIRNLRATGAKLDNPNVVMVITRYQDASSGGRGYTPIVGGSGSIQAASAAMQACRQGPC